MPNPEPPAVQIILAVLGVLVVLSISVSLIACWWPK